MNVLVLDIFELAHFVNREGFVGADGGDLVRGEEGGEVDCSRVVEDLLDGVVFFDVSGVEEGEKGVGGGGEEVGWGRGGEGERG